MAQKPNQTEPRQARWLARYVRTWRWPDKVIVTVIVIFGAASLIANLVLILR